MLAILSLNFLEPVRLHLVFNVHSSRIGWRRAAVDANAPTVACKMWRGAVEKGLEGATASIGVDRVGHMAGLTPTQMKVLEGVHLGLLNKQIAFNLGIAEATVKAHMTALMRKLNVRNRTQVAIAVQTMAWSGHQHPLH